MINVKKHSGDLVPFSEVSLLKSLLNSGATNDEAKHVADLITQDLYEGIPTKELYQKAFEALKTIKSSIAARYSLKRALQKLGPDGFYFEKWMGKIFETQGFNAVTGQTLEGQSGITHEIDVVAANENEKLVCECKFRNDLDAKISVTTPMYFLSRFTDLKDKGFTYFNKPFKPTKGYLITNAFFTSDSIQFANYYGIELISWNYPENRSIKTLTDKFGMYPITCLTTLTDEEEKLLLDKNCILVRELIKQPIILNDLNCSSDRIEIVLKEAKELVKIN